MIFGKPSSSHTRLQVTMQEVPSAQRLTRTVDTTKVSGSRALVRSAERMEMDSDPIGMERTLRLVFGLSKCPS